MSTIRRLAPGVLASAFLLIAPAAVARAQDGANDPKVPGHCPTCGAPNPDRRCPTCGQPIHTPQAWEGDDEKVDRRMRDALRREYGDPNRPLPQPQRHTARIEEEPPPPPPPPPPPRKDEDVTSLDFRLMAMAGHWSAGIFDVRLSSRGPGGTGTGGSFDYADHVHGDELGNRSETQFYRAQVNLLKCFGLQATFREALYRSNDVVTQTFDYDGIQFNPGAVASTKLYNRIFDVDAVVRPIDDEHFNLDVYIGGRYVYAKTEISDGMPFSLGGTGLSAVQVHEGGMPMFGLGFGVKPIRQFELFARTRFGGWEWEDDHDKVDRNTHTFTWHHSLRSMASVEAEAGIKVLFAETIGFVAGYRLEIVHLLYEKTGGDSKRTDFKQEGPFVAGVLQF
jgi:hypothetical protein